MRIANRRRAIATFITIGVLLTVVAAALNVGWIILNWREGLMLVLGIILFAMVIAGLILNTIFLVREIKRNERQDSFLNAVTHELKTPIASIKLYLETLERYPVDGEKAGEFYKVMHADADRLLATVEQILRAGEVGNRKALENALEVDLSELLRQCVEIVRVRYNLDASAIRFVGTDETIAVMGNPEDLKTAMLNLLDNAVKYSEPSHVDVRVELHSEEKTAEVVVRDRGVGIPSGELKQVFKRFYRIGGSTSKKVRGTGLGLFIVQSIVRKHSGSIAAESAGIGKGTTIRMRLPKVYQA